MQQVSFWRICWPAGLISILQFFGVFGASLRQRNQILAGHEPPTLISLRIQTENAEAGIVLVQKEVMAGQKICHFMF